MDKEKKLGSVAILAAALISGDEFDPDTFDNFEDVVEDIEDMDVFEYSEGIEDPIISVDDDIEVSDSSADEDCESFSDLYSPSFGKKYHVTQVGGGLGEADVDITKIPGTSHQWNVKYKGEIIAKISSLLPGTRFYVPGIGTCQL